MDVNDLHKRAAAGEAPAREELFRILTVRYRLFARQKIWNKTDGEEVVQEALMVVARKYRDLVVEKSFSAWAHQVLCYEIASYYKRHKFREVGFGDLADGTGQFAGWTPDPELKLQLLKCLRKIGRTNSTYARILNFHYLGYTVKEVCDRLKIRRNNAYVLLSRARVWLVTCLEKGEVK